MADQPIRTNRETVKLWPQLCVSLSSPTKPPSAAIVSELHHRLFWMRTYCGVESRWRAQFRVRPAEEVGPLVPLSMSNHYGQQGSAVRGFPVSGPAAGSSSNALLWAVLDRFLAPNSVTVTRFKLVILTLTHLNSRLEFDSQINWWTRSSRWNTSWN